MNLTAQLTLALAIVNFLNSKNYTRASYDRLAANIGSDAVYFADDLDILISLLPTVFRPATIRGGKPGLALR